MLDCCKNAARVGLGYWFGFGVIWGPRGEANLAVSPSIADNAQNAVRSTNDGRAGPELLQAASYLDLIEPETDGNKSPTRTLQRDTTARAGKQFIKTAL